MARLRTWAEFEARGLWPGERKLVDACKAGEECVLGDGTRPDGPSPERNIRADLLRYLILGGCEACRTDEWGVQLVGACVVGTLDISFCRARGPVALFHSRFEKKIEALQCSLEFLNLNGSALVGLDALGADVRGGVFLLGTDCEGEIRLQGASIGGQLACAQARFCNKDGDALNAEGAAVTGDVFLRGTIVEGEVSFSGARIRGQLDFEGARLRNAQGTALNAQKMQVAEGLLWRGLEIETGTVDFVSAHVGDLVDDLKSWPTGGRIVLNGFTYDRILGSGFLDARDRLVWLKRGRQNGAEFFPQPYTQLAKVLGEMGHTRDARKILISRENGRRQVQRDLTPSRLGSSYQLLWHSIERWLWGYGFAPERGCLFALGILIVLATAFANRAWQEGSFAPNSAPILLSDDWKFYDRNDCVSRQDPGCIRNPSLAWSAKYAPGMDWDSFNSLGYGLDLVVPILDLGQTEAWAPSKDRGFWGMLLWCGRWVLATLGWVATALLAALLAGAISPRQE